MAEEEGALDERMEEIKVNLPRFDRCISLLRAEIDELKAGKLDHCLREIAAAPLIDSSLHSALSKAIDGGLLLPAAPKLSDSDSETEEGKQERKEEQAEQSMNIVEKREEEEEEEEEDGAAYADGEGATAGGGAASGGQREIKEAEKISNGDVDGFRDLGGLSKELAACSDSHTPKRGESMTVVSSEEIAAKSEGDVTAGVVAPPNPSMSRENGNGHSKLGASDRSRGSPLRDRPPIRSGGGARVAPAAPPRTPTGSLPSSYRRRGSSAGVESAKIERENVGDGAVAADDGDKTNGGLGEGPAAAAAASEGPAAPRDSPEPKAPKKKPGGVDNGMSERADTSGSTRGRKRPRKERDSVSQASARDRKPRARRHDVFDVVKVQEGDKRGKEGADGGTSEKKTVGSYRADSVDAEHFRRIAMEVWERVNRHKFAVIFRKPVNPKDAPGYEKVIMQPMDLSLIKQRIASGALMSLDDLHRDLFVMCNNAMVFNGKGDPYYDYSKDLRTYASDIIEEARRPGFVTADPGFDSVVAGSRTSRARQPSPTPMVLSRNTPRGKSQQRSQGAVGNGRGNGNGNGRRSSRESDSTSVADDVGDQEDRNRRDGRGRRGRGSDGDTPPGKRGGAAVRKAVRTARRRGSKSQPLRETESVEIVGSSLGASSDEGELEDGIQGAAVKDELVPESVSPRARDAAKKRSPVTKGKRRSKESATNSSDDERSTRAKERKPTKSSAKRTPTPKPRATKKRVR